MTPLLPDILPQNLAAVICGTAAGEASAARGAYYAGPGNQFWGVLERTRLTPRCLTPSEFRELPHYGLGLTDLEQRRAGMDRVALKGRPPIEDFVERITAAGPAIVAFNGKRAAELTLGRPVHYGRQPERVGGAVVWVLPSTGGAARGVWDEAVWRSFASAVRRQQRSARSTELHATSAAAPVANVSRSRRPSGRQRP